VTLGTFANLIEVAIFSDTGGVGVAVGDMLGDGVTVGDALAVEEVADVVVEDVEAFVLVSELDA
jgi:hypothetical protein